MLEMYKPLLSTHSFVESLVREIRRLEKRRTTFRVVEWGPGESTGIILASEWCAFLLSIESDPFWYGVASECYGRDPRLLLKHLPLPAAYDATCPFVRFPDSLVPFDLMFIDGSAYRTECALAAKRLLNQNGCALLHDYIRVGGEDDKDGPLDAPGVRRYQVTFEITLGQFPFVCHDVANKTTVFGLER